MGHTLKAVESNKGVAGGNINCCTSARRENHSTEFIYGSCNHGTSIGMT